MATQKDKLIKAIMMAQSIKNIAASLEYDAKDYDVRFPLSYARELKQMADEFLKMK